MAKPKQRFLKQLVLSVAVIELVAIGLIYLFSSSYGHSSQTNNHSGTTPPTAKKPIIQPGDNSVTINMTGDIMLASLVGQAIKAKGVNYPWQGLADQLAAADITIGNLECAVASGKHQPVPDKQFTFLAGPNTLAGPKHAGFDVLTLANNHVLDFGAGALAETLTHLDKFGILYTGAGSNIEQAVKPVIIESKGLKIGVLAFTRIFPEGWWVAGKKHPGIASGHDYNLMMNSVADLKSKVDFVIVSMHWGQELHDRPGKAEINLAHKLVDSGADLVLGHHPHVLQGLESYQKALIAYSTGNFIFTQSRDARGRQSVILQVRIDNSGIRGAKLLPAWIEQGRTMPATGETAAAIIGRLQHLSRPMGVEISSNGEIVWP